MEPQHIRYIITRAATAILLIVALLYGYGMLKKKQRKDAIVADLKSLCSDSSFFHQFHAEDAAKALVRGVGLIAEANQLGMEPDKAIDGGLGIAEKIFAVETRDEGPPIRERIIRSSLRSNYENFLKLGYTADFHTLAGMREGELPPVRTGPSAGSCRPFGSGAAIVFGAVDACGRSGILKMCTASRAVRTRQPAPAAGWGMLSSLSAACGSPAECITRKSSVQYAALTCGELACRYDESRMQTPSRDCLQILQSS